ncbi:MAG TPA: VIT1/CCC1 transporter family protein [Acidimicrobiia bacterium]|nr:VIT1/CCC1 transporter family protein [Acidimicrobiia bacterium]
MDIDHEYRHRPAFTEHLGKHRQYWRDIILGVNDGLVSMFLLVAGVVGGGMATRNILLTAVAGAIAGAVSMAAGEYMATKSQDEVFQGEIELEREHIRDFRDDELHELRDLLDGIGIDGDLREQVVQHFNGDDESLLRVMTALEFGVIEEERRSAYAAAGMSGGLFLLGAAPSVIPFAIVNTPGPGLVAAGIGSVTGLLIVGAIKTWATRGKPLRAAVENLLIAGAGGGLAYWIGVGFDNIVNG